MARGVCVAGLTPGGTIWPHIVAPVGGTTLGSLPGTPYAKRRLSLTTPR